MPQPEQKSSLSGLMAAVFVYSAWGFFSLYFAMLSQVSAPSILAFRVVFAFVILIPIVLVCGKGKAVFEKLSHKTSALSLFFSSAFITGNWLIFIMLVQGKNVLESSLGYFINPLISVLLGVVLGVTLNLRKQGKWGGNWY